MILRRRNTHGPAHLLILGAAIGLAGCASTASNATPTPLATTAPASVPVTLPTASAAPTAAESTAPETSNGPTAVPTSIDPCSLVPPAEASALIGSSFDQGSVTNENNTKICSYSQEGVVFEVLVGVAPDAATAKAQEPAFKKELEDGVAKAGLKDVKLTELPDFQPGVDAAVLSGSASTGGITVKGVALYGLKGAVFVALSEISIGGSVASTDALEAQARTTFGRLP